MDAPEARSSTRRALVTGAAGFIGSHVADSCLALGMEVVATDDLSGGFIENVPREATWAEGDLKDVEFCGSLWELGPFDYVYHLGAYAAEGLSHFVRRFKLRDEPRREHQPDQPRDPPQGRALRVRVVDRG